MPRKGRTKASMGSFVLLGQMEAVSELKSVNFQRSAWFVLMKYYLSKLGMPEATLSLLICGDARSRALNKTWRKKDAPTDVLSFPLNGQRLKRGFKGALGDIALNFSYTRRHAGRFAPELNGEAAFLVLHGILHLIGQHHDTSRAEAAMWRLSRKIFPPPAALLRRLKL